MIAGTAPWRRCVHSYLVRTRPELQQHVLGEIQRVFHSEIHPVGHADHNDRFLGCRTYGEKFVEVQFDVGSTAPVAVDQTVPDVVQQSQAATVSMSMDSPAAAPAVVTSPMPAGAVAVSQSPTVPPSASQVQRLLKIRSAEGVYSLVHAAEDIKTWQDF